MTSTSWPGLERAGPPADAAVGPFPRARFLEAWWRHLGRGEPATLEAGGSMLPMVEADGLLLAAGDPDLTDYHSPLGSEVELLGKAAAGLLDGHRRLRFDSLPEESARRLAAGLSEGGVEPNLSESAVTMVLDLTRDFLGGLDRKQRHEVRRKRRRYQQRVGSIEVAAVAGGEAWERFGRLHRLAPGEKGRFLVGPVHDFFADLAAQPGWGFHELWIGGAVGASLFGYQDDEGYYLYNSAYDPSMGELSPGIVLVTEVISMLGESRVPRFDFLKGDEGYKARLGAVPRPLYTVETG